MVRGGMMLVTKMVTAYHVVAVAEQVKRDNDEATSQDYAVS